MKKAKQPQHNEAFRQLVINAALMDLIDPVRGNPTRDPLGESFEGHTLTVVTLKQRFLDSFALICSTSSKGRETASAVCLEQPPSSAPVLRIARNRGLSQQDRTKVEKVLDVLIDVAKRDKTAESADSELLLNIAGLDKPRILFLMGKLKKQGFERDISSALSDQSRTSNADALHDVVGFRQWLEMCPLDTDITESRESPDLATVIRWYSDARWVYRHHLEAFLSFTPASPPPWLETLHKLARYCGAIKSMVKLAVKQPEVFAGIRLEAVEPSAEKTFHPRDKSPLRNTLERLLGDKTQALVDTLARRWNSNDPEKTLRKACNLTLTLHAEMQLLDFYDSNVDLAPRLRLMGTSKKACYLCHKFILQHWLRFTVSACHQKVYPTWLPPPSNDLPGLPRSRSWFLFSKKIEHETKQMLKTELNGVRRPKNLDSTAGPTLTATATIHSRS